MNFVYREVRGKVYFLKYGYVVVFKPFVDNTFLSPFNYFGTFVKNQFTM